MYMLASVAIYAADMPVAYKLALFFLISPSLLYYLARDVLLRLPSSWCEVALDKGGVAVVTRAGEKLFGQIEGKSIASAFLIVLRVKVEGYRLPIARVIFPDAMSGEDYRELCIRLKFV